MGCEPESQQWDDPDLGIDWPGEEPLLAPKNAVAPLPRELLVERLPDDAKSVRWWYL